MMTKNSVVGASALMGCLALSLVFAPGAQAELVKAIDMEHHIFMTTSGIYDPNVVDIAIKNIGIDNIMLGTDYPLEDVKGAVDFVKNLPISPEDKEKILYKNAERYILSR